MDDDNGHWDVNGLRRVIFSILDEREKRHDERFAAQMLALQKQEDATEKRFVKVEQLRTALDEATGTLMPRTESIQHWTAQVEKTDALDRRLTRIEGISGGEDAAKAASLARMAVAIVVISVIVDVVVFFLHK